MTSFGLDEKEWEFLSHMIYVYQYSLEKGYVQVSESTSSEGSKKLGEIKQRDEKFCGYLFWIARTYFDIDKERKKTLATLARETATAYYEFSSAPRDQENLPKN